MIFIFHQPNIFLRLVFENDTSTKLSSPDIYPATTEHTSTNSNPVTSLIFFCDSISKSPATKSTHTSDKLLISSSSNSTVYQNMRTIIKTKLIYS